MEGYNVSLLGQGLLAATLFMLALYAHQRRTQDATPVDIGWAIGIGFVSVYSSKLPRNLLRVRLELRAPQFHLQRETPMRAHISTK